MIPCPIMKKTLKACWLLLLGAVLITTASAEDAATLSLMPVPARIEQGSGQFLVGQNLRISLQGRGDARVKRASDRFLQRLSLRTGIPFLPAEPSSSKPNFIVNCAGPGLKIQTPEEDESYRLEVTANTVHLSAPNPLGILHGLQTFLQLIQLGPEGFAVPSVVVDDHPRFPWRGLMIDVSRHFFPVEVIKRNLDGMEALKLDVFHWHLSDDQGFRVESKKLPKFQQHASDGMYYTQAEIREVIEYARDRGIRVVPEFDMPGHATSWFAAYPELASASGPYEIARKWGVFNAAMDPTKDSTYRLLNTLIAEMARLFPDQYFHIGGDEVNGKAWSQNARIQAFMRKHNLENSHDLQAYFNQKLQKIVRKQGKIMEGWDEILHPGLPQDIVVQSWRRQKSLADASRRGYRGLLSFGYYLDLMEPASRHYLVDPLAEQAADLTAEEKKKILGGEACMWAEFVTPTNIDGRIWPRMAAVAERLWSPQEVRDLDQMYARLAKVSRDLEWLGLTHATNRRMMMERLTGGADIRSLDVLAGVLEPLKGYDRPDAKEYDSLMPLNRLVDTVPPESNVARVFAGDVDLFLKNPASEEATHVVRERLGRWRENRSQLATLLQSSALLSEAIPISQNLESAAAAGQQALDYLASGKHAPSAWREQQLSILKEAEKPQAEMLIMVVPSIRKLVEATVPE